MIHQLKSQEVPLLLAGGEMFASAGGLPGGFKPDVFEATWRGLIDAGIGVVFALFGEDGKIHGALGAIKCPDPFNGDMVAMENYWFVIPEFRGRGALLLREYEKWARAEGCKRISMVHLQKLQPAELKDFYTRLGYEHIESAYIKSLERTV